MSSRNASTIAFISWVAKLLVNYPFIMHEWVLKFRLFTLDAA